MPTPSPRDAATILRRRFPSLIPEPPPADAPYDAADDPTGVDDVGTGALELNRLRDQQAGELADRLANEESAAALGPREGYVQGEPGRRSASNVAAANAVGTRRRLTTLGGEIAADPYTGTAEQDRLSGIRGELDKAAMTQKPEMADAAKTLATQNAFAEYMKSKGLKTGEYEARASPVGRAAATVESDILQSRLSGTPQTHFDKQGNAHVVQFIGGVPHEIPMPFDAAGKANPITAQERNRQAMAVPVMNQIPHLSGLIDQAEQLGLLGPAEGRTVNDLLGGRFGTTGDATKDRVLGQLRIGMKALSTGFASLHGRGGANAGIGKELEEALYQAKMDPEQIRGALQEIRNWTQGYAQGVNGTPEPAAGGAGGGLKILSIERE
jgi:hypothetical protein